MDGKREFMSQKENVPRLRFPGFDGEWERKKLGEAGLINPPSPALPESFIYIDLESVNKGVLSKEEIVNLSEAPSRAQRLLQKEDILYQTVRPYQKNNLLFDREGVYVASTGYAQIRPVESSQFLFQFLHFQKFVDKVVEKCIGTSYPSINASELGKIEISIPIKEEQKKIASFLGEIDNKVSILRKKQSLLETYKRGMMQKLFSRELRFKDDDGKEFAEWESKAIGEIAIVRYGKDQKEVIDEAGAYPILGTGGEMGRTNCFLYDRPSVLIGRKGTIDKPMYLETPFWTVDTLFYTEIVEGNLPRWVFYLFQTINWYQYNEASGVPSLSGSTISKIPVVVPPLAEQTKIANFLSSLDDKIALVSKEIEKMEEWKKGLLQDMFV